MTPSKEAVEAGRDISTDVYENPDKCGASFAITVQRAIDAATAPLKQKHREELGQAIHNLAGDCGACAEIGMCGSTMHPHESCVVAERNALQARIRELEADMKRLNWLDEQRQPIARNVGIHGEQELLGYGWGVEGQNFGIREAIDAAQQQEKEQ